MEASGEAQAAVRAALSDDREAIVSRWVALQLSASAHAMCARFASLLLSGTYAAEFLRIGLVEDVSARRAGRPS